VSIVDVMTSKLVSVSPEESAAEAIARMVEAAVGSIVVCEGPELVGIFTERDVLRLAAEGVDFEATRVGDVMTREVVIVGPDDDVLDVAHLLAERRIRHAPVTEGGCVLGVIGIRDLMTVLLERAYERHDPSARDTARELLRPPERGILSREGA
jgi:CBS domain-containing protein